MILIHVQVYTVVANGLRNGFAFKYGDYGAEHKSYENGHGVASKSKINVHLRLRRLGKT